jgi:hypothetical protein
LGHGGDASPCVQVNRQDVGPGRCEQFLASRERLCTQFHPRLCAIFVLTPLQTPVTYVTYARPASACISSVTRSSEVTYGFNKALKISTTASRVQWNTSYIPGSTLSTNLHPSPSLQLHLVSRVSRLATQPPAPYHARYPPNIAFLIQPQPEEKQTKKDIGYSGIYKSVIMACSS